MCIRDSSITSLVLTLALLDPPSPSLGLALFSLVAVTCLTTRHRHSRGWRFWSTTAGSTNQFYEKLFLPGWRAIVSPSGWMCIGYWNHPSDSYPAASEQLALKMIRASGADLMAPLRVLDVGCGCGNSSLLFARTFPSISVVGINISPEQIGQAERSRDALPQELARRVQFLVADATDLSGLAAGSFDVVVALECAFHFESRAKFFEQAASVLKPGGALACADIVARSCFPLRPSPRWMQNLMLGVPDCNTDNMETYSSRLKAAGFRGVRVEPITGKTFRPFCEYFDRVWNGSQAELESLEGFGLYMWVSKFLMRWTAEYILAVGIKPA
eukprot:TRINITY_DN29501_c0_g1_i1.p1 TRINITY_DN29501_c0_g1~~TRINITY_DN29501_c0_g1_i1.p1  ORF type:complete len:329 (+),score=67.56 TRINITY_DN29501_c0_g1_i1:136-1122(+)